MKNKVKTYKGIHISSENADIHNNNFGIYDKKIADICTECPYPECIETTGGCPRYSKERKRVLGNMKKKHNAIGIKKLINT